MAPVLGLVAALATIPFVASKCYDPSPAFPVPAWTDGVRDLKPAFKAIERKLNAVIANPKYDIASYSIEVTSSSETLWAHSHTARTHNSTRPGDLTVDSDSIYRIASITKTFTTLSIFQQHKAGNLSLDDPISNYVPELAAEDSGALPWKDITLRILASQLSGIPREFTFTDLVNSFPDPTIVGLPPTTRERLPVCEKDGKPGPCGRKEFFETLKRFKPVFAPNQKSTYSNVAFDLLGIVVENVTGLSYEEYVTKAIFEELGMSSSSLKPPSSDDHAVLPVIPGGNYWDIDLGVQSPTGAIYASASDMSKYLRYILTHFNSVVTGVNWLMPASWGTGMNSFYGMPWETFRTSSILTDSQRPVTFITKSGALPGYYSLILVLEDYGLGITLFVGGQYALLEEIREIVTVELVRQAEAAIWHRVDKTYAGTYTAVDTSLNSTLELASSPSTGLILNSFISNGTDIFKTLIPLWVEDRTKDDHDTWRIQLVPTYLYKNETTQQGEIWRFWVSYERNERTKPKVWDDFCITDVDPIGYAGLPVTEVVFWHDKGTVELPAWQVTMELSRESAALVVQGSSYRTGL